MAYERPPGASAAAASAAAAAAAICAGKKHAAPLAHRSLEDATSLVDVLHTRQHSRQGADLHRAGSVSASTILRLVDHMSGCQPPRESDLAIAHVLDRMVSASVLAVCGRHLCPPDAFMLGM